MAELDALVRPERYPRSSGYDPAWLVSLEMGPNPLWLLEELSRDLDLRPGMRVLDLGSGKGATSVFLAREFGVQVVAVDLWVPPGTTAAVALAAGVRDQVSPLRADEGLSGAASPGPCLRSCSPRAERRYAVEHNRWWRAPCLLQSSRRL